MDKILFATDLDGTILHHDKMAAADLAAVHKLKNLGATIAVATGRPLNGVENVFRDHGFQPDYMVLMNGALVLDSRGMTITGRTIDIDTALVIADLCLERGFHVAFEGGSNTWFYRSEIPDGISDSIAGVYAIDDMAEMKDQVYLISITANKGLDEIEALRNEIESGFGKEIEAYRNVKYIDVVPKGISKGEGIRTIMELEGIIRQNVHVIGDSFNDIPMFREAGSSYTLSHAEDELKGHADFVVDSVAECIESHLLPEE
jgi:hypothetical protein